MTDEVLRWIQRENLIQKGDMVIAGVSGGADSVCLLLVLLSLREKLDFSLQAVHVEHGIRGEESREDAGFAETLCHRKKVPCRIYHVDVLKFAKENGMGVEEAARFLRYDSYRREAQRIAGEFHEMPARSVKIALAHHADDNAETVLFQMIRGSGIRGLGGIRGKRDFAEHTEIIRPLLNVTRKEIEDYLKEQGQDYRTDSTNLDTDYSRNRIRHEVIPQLSKINSRAVLHITQSAQMLQEVSDYLDSQVKKLLPRICRKEEAGCLLKTEQLLKQPEILQREVILSVLGMMAGNRKDIGNVHVEAVRNLVELQNGRCISLPYGMQAERVYEGILITGFAKPEFEKDISENQEYRITVEQLLRAGEGKNIIIPLPDGEISLQVLDFHGEIEKIPKKKYTKWLDYDKMKSGLQIRKRTAGDYLVIDEAGHRKKIKEYFIEEKIPGNERGRMWLVADDAHIIWVIGGRISADYKIQKNSGKILEIQITGGNYHED